LIDHEWATGLGLVGHEWKEDRLSYHGSVPDIVNVVDNLR
jgi:hypothetical protein